MMITTTRTEQAETATEKERDGLQYNKQTLDNHKDNQSMPYIETIESVSDPDERGIT